MRRGHNKRCSRAIEGTKPLFPDALEGGIDPPQRSARGPHDVVFLDATGGLV
jgi:hypothetical protein